MEQVKRCLDVNGLRGLTENVVVPVDGAAKALGCGVG